MPLQSVKQPVATIPVPRAISIVIKGELPDLNRFINSQRTNRFAGARMKKDATDLVKWEAIKFKGHGMKPPYFLEFYWHCKDKKKDKDNVAFAKKFILDGLQEAGVIPQDTWNVIDGFTDVFYIDKKNPRIEVVIISTNIIN